VTPEHGGGAATPTGLPVVPGVLDAAQIAATADTIAALQRPTGMIEWFPGGHCDPWNHVEAAMALTLAGRRREAEAAYSWLADTQHPDGWWWNYYRLDAPEGIEDPKLDTNVCAYVATGVWHHFCCTLDRGFLESMWPTVDRAMDWVLSMRTPSGAIVWARHVDHMPWDYALLTGSSSIHHSLRCAVRIAETLGRERPHWGAAADRLARVIADDPDAFEPKERWAMDWYYPVLCGVLRGDDALARIASRWDEFVMPGLGVRCVSDEPWVTAAETCECTMALVAAGEHDKAFALFSWAQAHRHDDGSYWTGIVYPDVVHFPAGERTSYTAAAVLLAADALSGASPAARLFVDPV
jgi:hypothetical protein